MEGPWFDGVLWKGDLWVEVKRARTSHCRERLGGLDRECSEVGVSAKTQPSEKCRMASVAGVQGARGGERLACGE